MHSKTQRGVSPIKVVFSPAAGEKTLSHLYGQAVKLKECREGSNKMFVSRVISLLSVFFFKLGILKQEIELRHTKQINSANLH